MKKPTQVIILFLTAVFLIMASGAAIADEITEMMSVSSSDTQGNGSSYESCVSSNGGFVAFQSYADNLVGNDFNYSSDVFMRDRWSGETILISVSRYGYSGNCDGYTGFEINPEFIQDQQGYYGSYSPSISADGRYVAFDSSACDLVDNDCNGSNSDIFVRDTWWGETFVVSVTPSGYGGCTSYNGGSYDPSISDDGRYVAFSSYAPDLAPNDYNGDIDIFVRDTELGSTCIASLDPYGYTGYGGSYYPSISGDGRYVAFASNAWNLVPDDTNGTTDIFVRDLQEGETVRVNINSTTGAQANSWSTTPSISADGRYVAFFSYATNLLGEGVPNGDSFSEDAVVEEPYTSYGNYYVHDMVTGETSGVTTSGDPSFSYVGYGGNAYISADGRYIAFPATLGYGGEPGSYNPEPNFTPGSYVNNTVNNGGVQQVFVYDRQEQETTMKSVNDEGTPANNYCYYPSISDNGLYVSFASVATNLVDDDTNPENDIFVHGPVPVIESIDPASGLIYGGTQVTISGSGFVDLPEVYFGNIGLEGEEEVNFVDSNTIIVETPAHAEGFVDVTVINPDGHSDTLEDGFEYICPAPTAPDDLAAYKNGLTDVFLSWNDNSDNEDGFVIERKVGVDGTWELYDILAPNTTTYEDNDLEQQVVYFYRVYAYNTCGESEYSNIAVMGINYVPVPGEVIGPNFPPIPDAGPDQTVCIGDTVSLDGSGSWDFNGEDVLTFSWSIVSAPAGSTATLTSTNTPESSLVTVVPGEYVIELTVSDGDFVRSVTVTITVEDCSGSATGQISADASSGGCFVATAAYGSADAPTIQCYIMLRDRYLLNSAWGRTFISLYYTHSPKYADIISQSETLRAAVRVLISPWTLLLVMGVTLAAATAFGVRR